MMPRVYGCVCRLTRCKKIAHHHGHADQPRHVVFVPLWPRWVSQRPLVFIIRLPGNLPVQRVIWVCGRFGDQDDLVRSLVPQTDISQRPYWCLLRNCMSCDVIIHCWALLCVCLCAPRVAKWLEPPSLEGPRGRIWRPEGVATLFADGRVG